MPVAAASRAFVRSLFAVAAAGLVASAAVASPDIAERTRAFAQQQAIGDGDVEVIVGEPDPRLALAPCARFDPFVPAGAKLWGRSHLGVRCVEGAAWTVYVPVQVKVYANVPVPVRPIPRGGMVGTADVRLERVDLAQFPAGIVGPDDAIDGKTAVRALAAGEPIRRDALRSPRIVEPGDAVRVVYDGAGFAVAIDGKALSSAADGESARVAVANGRVLTGVARAGKVVEVR